MRAPLKIIQTLYLPPESKDPLCESLGFLSPEFNWMGWALSCLQLKKLYGFVELYCNTAGYYALVNRLGLPYDKVHIVLNNLDFPPQLWAYPKLRTYSLQDEPFLHVDGDAFFWEALDEQAKGQQLIAQNMEINMPYYQALLTHLQNNRIELPQSIKAHLAKGGFLAAYNTGITGGTGTAFFKTYVSEGFSFIRDNYEKLMSLQMPEINMIFEQVAFYCLAEQKGIPVGCYVKDKISDMTYPGFAAFENVPGQVNYIHLMGAFKQNPDRCYKLAERLRHDYPAYYERVITECRKSGIHLYLDIHNHSKPQNEWLDLCTHENNNFASADYLLRNGLLHKKKFRTSEYLDIGKEGNERTACSLPLAYRMCRYTFKPDALDLVLFEQLRQPQTLTGLSANLRGCFDDCDTDEGYTALQRLVTMKLRRGLYNHMYRVCD